MRWLVAFLFAFNCLNAQTPDVKSQAVFDSAYVWSKANGLETGGCMYVFRVVLGNNTKYIVTNAVERVISRQPLEVWLDCLPFEHLWHTHWAASSDTTVGCEPSPIDRQILAKDALGFVICGIGPKFAIPFMSDTTKAPLGVPLRTHLCRDEPEVSKKRGIVNCQT